MAKGTTKRSGVVSNDVTAFSSLENAFASYGSYGGIGGRVPGRRQGRAANDVVTYSNIRNARKPFEDYGESSGCSDAIHLCQQAYWVSSIFKTTIDIMSEFSNSELVWEGGNKASRDFFKALSKKIRMWSVTDQFFREYYTTGNVIMMRFDGTLSREDAQKISLNYPDEVAAAAPVKLPIKYGFLNPMYVRAVASAAFSLKDQYYKVLSPYELARLRNPQTEQERDLFKSFPKNIQTEIKNGQTPLIPIDPEKVHAVFYKKMDYHPMAVPMGFSVLEDIDMKMELKKMDRVILRTVESTILHISMGAEPDKGGINPAALQAMREIFKNETVGRVLVSDYTTKINFIIPELNKVLGPEKYSIINEDLINGLNNIFWGEQKFANAMIKIKVFIERLKDGRAAFLNDFLIPEVQRIAKMMGFKSYPTPKFVDIDIQDDVLVATMMTRLGELGILTPAQVIEAIKTGVLPTKEDMDAAQTELVQQRQEGLYTPITGPMPLTFDQQQTRIDDQTDLQMQMKTMDQETKLQTAQQSGVSKPGGRPKGTKKPQKSKRVRPQGASASNGFSLVELKGLILEADKVINRVEDASKKLFKLKKLNEEQTEAALSRATSIIENEPREKWLASVDDYVKGEMPVNEEAIAEIEEIAFEHQASRLVAALLYHSRLANGE